MKQIRDILSSKHNFDSPESLKQCKMKLEEIFGEMWESCKISKTSSKLMLYNVEDLLDYGQMESGNFRKNIQHFDAKKAIQEIINVQKYKASDKKINLFLQSREFVDGNQRKDTEPENFKIVSD
jgi:signal transduction histidine kinase